MICKACGANGGDLKCVYPNEDDPRRPTICLLNERMDRPELAPRRYPEQRGDFAEPESEGT